MTKLQESHVLVSSFIACAILMGMHALYCMGSIF